MVEAVLLHSSLPGSWKYMPEFLRRVKDFCRDYDSDVNVEVLIQYLKSSFVSENPPALMIVGVDDDGIVFGHMLALAENWFGNHTVTVVQMAADQKIPEDVWQSCHSAVKLFACAHQAQFIQLAARNKALVRLYRRRGFSEVRTIMRMPFDGRAAQAGQGVV